MTGRNHASDETGAPESNQSWNPQDLLCPSLEQSVQSPVFSGFLSQCCAKGMVTMDTWCYVGSMYSRFTCLF